MKTGRPPVFFIRDLYLPNYQWLVHLHYLYEIMHTIMTDIQEISKALTEFRDARNWAQFHNPKDLALAISIEAGELNELYLWRQETELEEVDKERVREELADIFAYAFLLAGTYEFDIKKMILDKIRKNHLKYPVEKARNSARKYRDL